MVRNTRHRRSLHLLVLMDSLTEQQSNISTNGVSERYVETIKGLLEKSEDQYETLLSYRSTPLSTATVQLIY